MTLALAICMPAAYVATRCPSRRTETLMAGLLVLSTAPVIVRWVYRIKDAPKTDDDPSLTIGWGGRR